MIFSHAIQLLQCALFLLGAICVIPASASQVDKLLAKDNAAKGVEGLITGQALSDLAFLRNASIDLVGRIPTYAEIREYQEWPLAKRRSRLVDRLLKDEGFADRWTVFLRKCSVSAAAPREAIDCLLPFISQSRTASHGTSWPGS